MTGDLLHVVARLRAAFARDTSQLPDEWSESRPSTGHCAVVSVILQRAYGGDIVRARTSHGVVHYWNVIDGVTIDATRDQFDPGESFIGIEVNPPAAVYLFNDTIMKIGTLLERAGLVVYKSS